MNFMIKFYAKVFKNDRISIFILLKSVINAKNEVKYDSFKVKISY